MGDDGQPNQRAAAAEPAGRRHGKITIVTPVFNDWTSFAQLCREIDRLGRDDLRFQVIAVDDGSSQKCDDRLNAAAFEHIDSITLVELVCNLGHQRAIAVGLVLAARTRSSETIVVMDCDGEDSPSDVIRLLETAEQHPRSIICAQRSRRSESWTFRGFYRIYQFLFRMLTGTVIDFGNFSLVPRAAAEALVHNPNTWNHLAAAVTRARLPMFRIPTVRGRRYADRSSMNLVSLVLHGLSAISVYTDVVLVRALIMLLLLSGLTVIGVLCVIAIRFTTDLAIPGWASNVVGVLSIIFLQSILFIFMSIFMLLNGRSAKPIVPATDSIEFVRSTTELRFDRERASAT